MFAQEGSMSTGSDLGLAEILRTAAREPAEEFEILVHVLLRIEGGRGVRASPGGPGLPLRRGGAGQSLDGLLKSAPIAARKHETSLVREKTFADALDVIDDGWKAISLGLDHKIRKRFRPGGVNSDVRGQVERGGIALPSEEFHLRAEAARGDGALA